MKPKRQKIQNVNNDVSEVPYEEMERYLGGVCLSICFAGCSKPEEFDAQGYVKAYLDAAYMGDYDSYETYAGFLDEDPAKLQDKWSEQEYEEVANALLKEYPGEELDNVSNIFSYLAEAKRLAKYEVLDVTKNEEGYKVKVKVEPADVFEKWKEHLDIETVKIQAEKVGYGIDESLAEFLRIAITENTYEEPREIEVQVIEDEKDVYIEMSQMEALDYALFPQRVHERVILAMFTCPNEELFSQEAVAIIGEGTEGVQDIEKVKEKQEQIADNWEKKVGDAFASGALDKFLGESASFYLAQAQMEGKEISVKEIKNEEESEMTETYAVTILNGEAEETVKVGFTYNKEDLIEKVSFPIMNRR